MKIPSVFATGVGFVFSVEGVAVCLGVALFPDCSFGPSKSKS